MSARDLWQDQLCRSLLSGTGKADALRLAEGLGASRPDAEAAADAIVSGPLFGVARRAWVELKCRDWVLRAMGDLAAIRSDPRTVDELNAISQPEFLVDYYCQNRPLFLRGIASDWPAVCLWNQEYLKGACGPEIVEIMHGRDGAPTPDQTYAPCLRRQMLFSEFVDLVYSTARSNDFYLVARNRLFESGRATRLMDDFGELSIVNTRSKPSDVKLWLGPAGTYTALHYDGRNNVLVQIIGTKTIRLYAPYYSEFMCQTAPWYAGIDPGQDNNALPPSASPTAPPCAVLQMGPGDALFIPVGWWHAVIGHSVSLSLNFHDFQVPNSYDFSLS